MSILHVHRPRPRARHAAQGPGAAADAVLSAISFSGATSPPVFLSGLPAFLGTEDRGDREYGRLRIGTGPGSEDMILSTASPEYAAALISAGRRMLDQLADEHMYPVPFGAGGTA
jgi:hypothetical protein